MRAVDQAAPEATEVLVGRAGAAVSRAAVRMLGGTYGRRVTVVVGPGTNGADGRAAAARLRRLGVRVAFVEASPTGGGRPLPPGDLVIDAAYGTGFRGSYQAPEAGGTPVLAVDIPSGVDGLTGQASSGAVRATATVSFAALKPGLLFGRGVELAGAVEVADIGLDVSGSFTHLVEDADVARLLPERARDGHKWDSAVLVVAGSPGMMGAPRLAARAALRAGAGYVLLGVPGAPLASAGDVGEVVGIELSFDGWAAEALSGSSRVRSIVAGPGLGRESVTQREVRRLLDRARVPLVIDGDALAAVEQTGSSTVLTPHDGEFATLTGGTPPGVDRLAAARALALRSGAVVVLKGATTVVAEPSGEALLVTSGRPNLATAGTGDVLSGMIGALLAQGLSPMWASGLAAHIHGRAAALGLERGLVAGDLLDLVPCWLSQHG